ncbi:MAG: hypothetical protein WED10_14045 [Brumimicrobium sp.]
MKESEDKFWKGEILKDFEKPTHQGFTEDVMRSIEKEQEVKSFAYQPLIGTKQWLITAFVLAIIILVAVFVEYKIEFDLGYFEKYSQQLLELLNDNSSFLWITFSLVGVFFVYTIIGKNSLFRR